MNVPRISEQKRLERLSYPSSKVRAVLDTDTYNEIDDPFAVVYAMKSPEKIKMEAFYAAPFFNSLSAGPKDGMEKSYRELEKIKTILPEMAEVPICRGSESYLPSAGTAVESEAARDLVERALASPDNDPLYVIAIGAITNIASAILLEPRIIGKIVIVWLGGHALHWPHTKEFNLQQDLHASRVVLDSGVPLVLVPCAGAASHMITTLSEIRDYVKDCGDIGAYLDETYKRCAADHFGYSRVIWDMAAIAYLVNPDWLPNSLVHSPVLSEQFRWSFDPSRHLIRCVRHVNRDPIFQDFFRKLR
jgi:hypothetical protein